MLTLPNCLSSWMSEPLPNELVRLAWKARVGYSWDKIATQRFWWEMGEKVSHRTPEYKCQTLNQGGEIRFCTVTQVGMRSHLFRTKMRCFHCFSFFKYVSMLWERVPMGSRASSTWMMTSDESITFQRKIVITLKWLDTIVPLTSHYHCWS